MKEVYNYEKELLAWQERQITYRCRYADTPPGFLSEAEEQAARDKLEKMKKNHLEKSEHRPLTSHQAQKQRFVGRERYLEQIQQMKNQEAGPVVLCGIGGIGKSALAIEYVYRCQHQYDIILLLPYNGSLQKLFCDDSQIRISNLQYTKDKYGNLSRYFEEKIKILCGIAQQKRTLIVIDNWNMEGDKQTDVVFSIPCDFLITSRLGPKAWKGCTCLEVQALETNEEWERFIAVYQIQELSAEQREKFEQYRKKVGGHTLSMMLWLQSAGAKELQGDFAQELFRRFSLKKTEKQILCELSVMPVQGIPLQLYLRIAGASVMVVRHLSDCLLVQRGEREGVEWISLHPVIAEAAREVFHPTMVNCRNLFYGFAGCVENVWNHTYQENQKYEPYVFALVTQFSEPAAWMARTLDALVTWLWVQEYYEDAQRGASLQRQQCNQLSD